MHNPDANIAICITGWHYPEPFYAAISQLSPVTPFVISHRPRQAVPAYVFAHVAPAQVLYRPNRGYDWGCYQQFLDTGLWRQFDYIIFMHDDVEIKSNEFVHAAIEQLARGAQFVGNGRNSTKTNWPDTHYCCYAHARWKPASRAFRHDTIRGSFIATTSVALHGLGDFEVFWDRFRLDTRLGNWSLIATCGKIQALFGEMAFQFLSDTYLDSPYIRELERGNTAQVKTPYDIVRYRVYERFSTVCAWYMAAYLTTSNQYIKSLLTVVMRPWIVLFSR